MQFALGEEVNGPVSLQSFSGNCLRRTVFHAQTTCLRLINDVLIPEYGYAHGPAACSGSRSLGVTEMYEFGGARSSNPPIVNDQRRRWRRQYPSASHLTYQSGLPLVMHDGLPVPPASSDQLARRLQLKRFILDIPLATLSLIALAPAMLFIAVNVKLTSPGPALIRQPRVGLNGQEFRLLKFRSMRLEATDLSGVNQTKQNDDRVTPFGRFIRSRSLDELPQLWNILVGDMSFIGPRPMVRGQLAAGEPYQDVVPYYEYRHQVRPGLSGWAQVNGLRGPTTDRVLARKRIDHDCAYVQSASLSLDIYIMMETLRREFWTGTGS